MRIEKKREKNQKIRKTLFFRVILEFCPPVPAAAASLEAAEAFGPLSWLAERSLRGGPAPRARPAREGRGLAAAPLAAVRDSIKFFDLLSFI